MSYESRLITRYDLPLANEVAILHPEKAVLCFSGDASFDIGAYCYLRRSAVRRIPSQINMGRPVDISSLSQISADQIRSLIKYISDEIGLGGARPMSMCTWVSQVGRFFDWADANSYSNVLGDEAIATAAFRQYVHHLRERVNQNKLSNNTGAMTQNNILSLLTDYIGIDNPHHGLNLLRISKHARVPTSPPSEDEQAKVLSLCSALFNGLGDLVLNNRPYPYLLKVPAHLAVADGGLWVFPNIKWCMPKYQFDDRDNLKTSYWAFDYFNGGIDDVEKIADKYVKSEKNTRTAYAEHSIRSALSLLEAANENQQDKHRRGAALNAHNAFVIMFMANTGMNWSCVRELPWDEAYEVGVERQGFRAIKWRAGGKLVSFEIQAVFLPTFKQYLKLRGFLLNGVAFDRLFLTCNLPGTSFEPLKVKTQSSIFQMLQRIDPSLPKIMSKKWRAGKSDWLLRHADPATTALILQNSEETVIQSYAAGSETTHIEEMSKFFEQIEDTVINRGQQIDHGIVRSVGVCSSFGNPHQIGDAPVTADCKGSEGCLFCDKFRVHADEHDTRKLLSCRYCLQQTAHLTANEEHFQSLFGPIFIRIEQILVEVDRRESGIVEKIRLEVEHDGELDPYWASKFEMLVDLELVA